ncbi:MAG: hypothetical protein NTV34_18740 [Proteobacteria bacterium]|nr:hypothetical protein [Pseudomonadota bacterium]
MDLGYSALISSKRNVLVSSIFSIGLLGCGRTINDSPTDLKSTTQAGESNLFCKSTVTDFLQGRLYDSNGTKEALVGTYTSGHIASCEFAIRASKNGTICIEDANRYKTIEISSHKTIALFGNNFSACVKSTNNSGPLETREGYIDFIDAKELANSIKHLPVLADTETNTRLKSAGTMWYDESSMIFSYQDSFGNPEGPQGLRANRVAFDVGSNSTVPDINALTNYFEMSRFKFPFSIAPRSTDNPNSYVINFWSPPKNESGSPLPVIWWKNASHWHWTFPVGTLLGEVLMTRPNANSDWYVFEVRTRKRELNRWTTDIFRPFTSAVELSQRIKQERPNWESSDLAPLVNQLESNSNLIPAKLESPAYSKIFPTINGYHDVLPETSDTALIKTLLSETVFHSAMNSKWKSDGAKISYAPTTKAAFHIVPRDYIAGLLESSEESCSRCHMQSGRPLGQLDRRLSLYGEIWGEDQVFTWHPFKVVADMFTVSEGSRLVNPRLVEAGLIVQRRPIAGETNYKELPRPYRAEYN